ncbi:MAG: glycoside hydrolase family 24 [Hyphomicrobiales bacterium]|nr:glycoside hydrolase family 24 [Hyphomicrobiales bacterium]
MMSFHEVRFPIDISMNSRGGPQRTTDIVVTGSGREQRNTRWLHSRRRYDAGTGVKTPAAIALVLAFFEERRGRLYGFRWRDRADDRSCAPGQTPVATDQALGAGDGVTKEFQLVKTYGAVFAPYRREIRKPVADSVRVAVNGVAKSAGADFVVDATTGVIHFQTAPAMGTAVSAGFLFDTPVRFDTDFLEIDHAGLEAGQIPKIPLIEIQPG